MLSEDRRVRIIAGHYGSGKTEIAVNYAVALKKRTSKVALADLDIVNVYFRSREKTDELENMGIHVIASSIIQDNCDLPAISPEISTPAKDKSYNYIIDLGGNDVGTVTLARLRPILDVEEVDFLMVVNTNRPDTATAEGIIEQQKNLEFSAGFKVTGYINNTNFIRESTAKNLIEGDRILREVSQKTGIPIRYTACAAEVMDAVPKTVSGDYLPLKLFMRKEWM